MKVARRAATDPRRRRGLLFGNGFHVRRSEMFVCAGDVSKEEFDAIVDGTVTACARALWKHYFNKRPDYPIRVYLFSEERTYRFYAKKLFGDSDVSRFGYFKPDEKALVMNIGTGTGTLSRATRREQRRFKRCLENR